MTMNILFLGDSLIEFFDWEERFPDHQIANLGVAGESVGGLLSRVIKILETHSGVELIFIMSGINNLAMDDDEFFNSYRIILERLSFAYHRAEIYVHSLLPVVVDFISSESIDHANENLKALAEEMNLHYLDVYSKFIDTKGRAIKEYLLDDGVHLSGAGYDVWARVVEEVIKSFKPPPAKPV
jgi:lysophospholipase L1-like esterase